MATPSESGNLFGIPLGKLGWFACLLMGVATGFAAFFASTFLAIMGMLAYVTFSGHSMASVDFSLTYRDIGLPIGIVVMAIALAYLGTQWARRHIHRS